MRIVGLQNSWNERMKHEEENPKKGKKGGKWRNEEGCYNGRFGVVNVFLCRQCLGREESGSIKNVYWVWV